MIATLPVPLKVNTTTGGAVNTTNGWLEHNNINSV